MPIQSKIISSNELNEIIARETTNLVIITDSIQKIVYVNNTFTQLTGYSSDYCIGKNPSFLQGKNTDPSIKSSISKSLKTDHRAKEIICNSKKDGTEYWINLDISPVYDEYNRLKYYISIQTDVTDLINAQKNEKTARQHLRSIFDSSSSLNIVIDREYKLVDYNLAASLFAESITGSTLSIGQNLTTISSQISWQRFLINFENSWKNKLPLHLGTQIILSNDTKRWFHISYDPILDHDENVESMLMSFTDINLVKENEYKLITQNQILSAIAEIYSHDIRGPVASLLGLMNLIDNNHENFDSVSEEVRQTIEKLDKSVKSISKLSTILGES